MLLWAVETQDIVNDKAHTSQQAVANDGILQA
jgi:hypothetical protein